MTDSIYKQMGRKVAAYLEEPLRETMIARQVMMFDTRQTGLGISNIQSPYYADMKAAEIQYELPTGAIARDQIQNSMAETRIVTIRDGFQVDREQFEAFRDKGIDIDAANALSATQKVIQKENALLLKGWMRDGSGYTINGLAEAAGTDAIGSYDFATYGNPLKKVAEGKAALASAGVYETRFNLLLHPTQYAQLDASVSTGGIREMDQVKSMIGGGLVLQNTDISENYGLLLPYDPAGKYFRAVLTYPLTVSFGYDATIGEDISPIFGLAMERVGLRVSQSTAVCKLSNV
jgi:uncharacterized linocin/CFP29 family protein